jgi:hypothetical protein
MLKNKFFLSSQNPSTGLKFKAVINKLFVVILFLMVSSSAWAVNNAPIITGTAPSTVYEDSLYIYSPTLEDVDGDSLTLSSDNLPSWLSINSSSLYIEQTNTNNPFNGVDVGFTSKLTLVDIDSDGDYDAFIGEWFGTIKYYKNTGSHTSPIFTEQTSTNNPFDGVTVGNASTPTFVDSVVVK